MHMNPYMHIIERQGWNLLEASNYLEQHEITDEYIAEAFLLVHMEVYECQTAKQLYDRFAKMVSVTQMTERMGNDLENLMPHYVMASTNAKRAFDRIGLAIQYAGEIELK